MIDTIQPCACQELLALLNSKYPWCYPPAPASANILIKQDDTLLYMVDYRLFSLKLFCPIRQAQRLELPRPKPGRPIDLSGQDLLFRILALAS